MKRIHRTLHRLACLVFTGTLLAQESNSILEGFRRVDRDGDGRISPAEFEAFPRLKDWVSGDDASGDGFLSFEEVRDRMLATGGAPNTGLSALDKLTPGEHTRRVTVGKVERCYRVHVPTSYDEAKATPVVIAAEKDVERRLFYSLLWEIGASQSDAARIRAENFDLTKGLLMLERSKTEQLCRMQISDAMRAILSSRTASRT